MRSSKTLPSTQNNSYTTLLVLLLPQVPPPASHLLFLQTLNHGSLVSISPLRIKNFLYKCHPGIPNYKIQHPLKFTPHERPVTLDVSLPSSHAVVLRSGSATVGFGGSWSPSLISLFQKCWCYLCVCLLCSSSYLLSKDGFSTTKVSTITE